MSRLLTTGAFSLAAAVLIAAPSQARVFGTLTFDSPTGTVLSTDDIPVWLTLHMDELSDPVTTDASGEITAGLTDEGISAATYGPNGEYNFDPDLVTRTNVNVGYGCSGAFTNGCAPDEYLFDFNYNAPSFIGAVNLDLQPGSTTSWFFGTFRPVGGNAAAGTYSFYNAYLSLTFNQPNQHQSALFPDEIVYGGIDIAVTCPNTSCAFTRDVVAVQGGVPEPATWALMIGGFGGAGVALRRRRALARTAAI